MKFTVVLLICTLAITHVVSSPLPPGSGQGNHPVVHDRPESPYELTTGKKLKAEGKPPLQTNELKIKPKYTGIKKSSSLKPQEIVPFRTKSDAPPHNPNYREVVTDRTVPYTSPKDGKTRPSNHPGLVVGVNMGENNRRESYSVLPISSNLPDQQHKIIVGTPGNKFKFVLPGSQISMIPKTLTSEDIIDRKAQQELLGCKGKATKKEMDRITAQMAKCVSSSCKCPEIKAPKGSGKRIKALKGSGIRFYYNYYNY